MIVGGSKCVLADDECTGRLEWHHAIKQQRLKRWFRYGAIPEDGGGPVRYRPRRRGEEWEPDILPALSLDDILGDTRNRIFLCSRHHELVTNSRLKVELPPSVWEFAAEFGLTAQLENDIARAA